MRTKECEVQYNLMRFEQQKKDAETQLANSRALSAQVSTFSQTESELRSQLNIYVEKFKQVCTRNVSHCMRKHVERPEHEAWKPELVLLFNPTLNL